MPAVEILLSRTAKDTLGYLRDIPDAERRQIGSAARARVLAGHTAAHRAAEFERYMTEAGLSASGPDVAAAAGGSGAVETTVP